MPNKIPDKIKIADKFILLWLEAPLQSWGYDSLFGVRNTLEFPTKSGVLGLILCAMGRTGEERALLETLSSSKHTIISYKKIYDKNNSSITQNKTPQLEDFQVIGNGYDEKDPWHKLHIPKKLDGSVSVGGGTMLSTKFYLQDAVFAVVLGCNTTVIDEVEEGLKKPVFSIYFGRKNCIPSDIIFRGIFETEKDAVRHAHKIAQGKNNDTLNLVEHFRVFEQDVGEQVLELKDVPVQFGEHKIYKHRKVAIEYAHG